MKIIMKKIKTIIIMLNSTNINILTVLSNPLIVITIRCRQVKSEANKGSFGYN